MATYSTDLTTLNDAESGTWVEYTNYALGGAPAASGENYIQGGDCQVGTTGQKTGLSFSIAFDNTTNLTWTTGEVILMWIYYSTGVNLAVYATGGLWVAIGSSLTALDRWIVGGSDYARNPYGGWVCVAVDPQNTSRTQDGGGNGGNYRYFGALLNHVVKITKGDPFGVDAIRYGRGEIYCTGTGCNFTGLAQYNDYNDVTNGYNRFGLFQDNGGTYLWKGLMSLGQSGTSATFSDSNKTIIIDDAAKTYLAFNRIAIRNASTSVTWTNITFIALGTVSPGELEVVENATVLFTGCSFNSMGTFTFLTNSDVLGCTFNNCNQIDAGGGDFSGSTVSGYSGTPVGAFLWDVATNPDTYTEGMSFVKGSATKHAIQFDYSASIASTLTLRNIDFSGYSGTVDNAATALYFPDTGADVDWTVNLVGCTGTIQYRKARTGDTVTLVVDPVTTTITVRNANTNALIEDARVLLYASSNAGDLPYDVTLTSITRSGTTATATFPSAHGLVAGDKVWISGATDNYYNGAHTVVSTPLTTTLTYTMLGTPAADASGTLKATGGIFNTLTNASGQVTDSRSISVDQPIEAYARRGTTSPLFKTSPVLTDSIDSANGLTATLYMIPDE